MRIFCGNNLTSIAYLSTLTGNAILIVQVESVIRQDVIIKVSFTNGDSHIYQVWGKDFSEDNRPYRCAPALSIELMNRTVANIETIPLNVISNLYIDIV